jgi:raffinose/stachyose/melibiose transport system permease protein
MNLSYREQKRLVIATFLLVPLVFIGVFFLYPCCMLFALSFSQWDGLSPISYVGLSNYREIFASPRLFGVIFHNMAYLVSGLLQLVAGILLAVIINREFRGRNFFRAILFMPYIINSVSVVYMFSYMFLPNGPYNHLIMALGLSKTPLKFLSKDLVNISLSFISFWQYLGFYTVIFLAGLQTISSELYEAASIDGASFWQQFRKITLPHLRPLVEINLFLVIAGSLKAFDGVFILTKGGPNEASHTLMTKSIDLAFKYNDYGKSASLSIITAFIIIAIIMLQRALMRERA